MSENDALNNTVGEVVVPADENNNGTSAYIYSSTKPSAHDPSIEQPQTKQKYLENIIHKNASTAANNASNNRVHSSGSKDDEQLQPRSPSSRQHFPIDTTDQSLHIDQISNLDQDAHPDALQQGPLHHLTRHWLPQEQRGEEVLERLGAADAKSAESMIRGMSQRELRRTFLKVYGSATNSFNNAWLRRKLFEAIGVTGGIAKKARRPRPSAAARQRLERQAANAAAEAEALDALAEIAAGSPKKRSRAGSAAESDASPSESSSTHNKQ